MTGPQPTSVNIVGPHKIGKSSLLWRFYQICRNHRQYASSRYAVIYLSFQDGECQTENTFYQRVAEELRKAPVIQAKPSLVTAFSASNWERSTFAKAIRLCEAETILPVLCIDIVISNKNETLSCTISANNLIKRCGRMRIHYSSL
ncbi:hypothetical protein [Microcoleus vaginatus]|uniref:hypothetical protein n=1 Tax=Microcoleus vaginatus TaxID=119532 RepID=UPI00403F8C42